MTTAICALLCAAMEASTAVFCIQSLPRHTGPLRLSALLMPLGQLAFALSILWVAHSHEMATAYLAGVCIANALGCAGTCVLAQGIAETQSTAVNKERLRIAEEKAQAAAEYEALLSANTAGMHALCTRFACELKSLQTAMGEVDTPQNDLAVTGSTVPDFAALENALDKLEETTRSRYCANQTANAILVLKARACATAGIEFAFDGGAVQEVAIDDLELCSVFSNLLDNAITAADKARGETSPYVHISCTAKGVYLAIKVVNSCEGTESAPHPGTQRRKDASPAREHGWGLEIVRGICAAHDGSLVLERTAPTEACATAVFKALAKQS